MDPNISINRETCIKCGRCVRVCPSVVFCQESLRAEVEVQHPSRCFACGHCVAVCPTGSVGHPEFPARKVHKIDTSGLPSPEQLMLLIRARRSNRAFSAEPVPQEYLNAILEAAHRAPTASNLQQVGFTLVTDPEKLRMVSDYTAGIFLGLVKKLGNPFVKPVLRLAAPNIYQQIRRLKGLIKEQGNGKDRILRGATAVIFIHTPKGLDFGPQDSNLAYQNGSLIAESLGVSQFYTGFVCGAIRRDRKNELARRLGIDGTIHAGMALGMPQFRYPNYIDKKDISVNRL